MHGISTKFAEASIGSWNRLASQGLPILQRRVFYQIQLWAGLRVGETRSLEWWGLELDGKRPELRVRFVVSKSNCEDELLLHHDLVHRHAPEGVTLKHYQDFCVFDLWSEIQKLPGPHTEVVAASMATGTDGAPPQTH